MDNIISFKTDLPFYLRLPPNWFISYDDIEKECAILCSHRFGEIQFCKSTELINNCKIKEYDLSDTSKSYKEYQYRNTTVSEYLNDEVPTLDINRAKNGGFTELKSYTEVDMLLFVNDIDNVDDSILKNRISNNLNHFINIYRLITQDPYTFKIDFELDLYIMDIRIAEFPTNLKDQNMMKVVKNLAKIRFPDDIGKGRKEVLRLNHLDDIWPGDDLNDTFLDNFSTLIPIKYKMPLHYELVLLAQSHLKKKDYHISIILSETAFEVYIEKLLREILLNEGKDDAEIENLLGFNGSYGTHNNRLQYLDRISEERLNCSDRFMNSNEYNNWNSDLYTIRNDIIHRGMLYEISFEKCKKAIKAAKEAISLFEKKFSSFSNSIQICNDVSFLENTAGRISLFC